MATADSVKSKLQGLIDQANAATGSTDADLSMAVGSLIAGYGTGGGNSGVSGIYMAKVTPAEDLSAINITHNLGTTDILLAVAFAETLGQINPTFNGTVAKFWAKTDIPVRVTSTSNGQNFDSQFLFQTSTMNALGGATTSELYRCTIVDENTISFARGSSAGLYIAGVTYTVIIIAASMEV